MSQKNETYSTLLGERAKDKIVQDMVLKGESKEKVNVEDTLLFRGKLTKEKLEREKEESVSKE